MKVEFIFDYASPNAYIVSKMLPAIEQRTGVTVNHIPCLLGGIFKETGNRPPWQAFADVPSKVKYEELEIERFLLKHGLSKFRMNSNFPINTLVLMRGACAMKAQGEQSLQDYSSHIFSAMWENGVNMSDPQEVAKVVSRAGYDQNEFLARINEPQVKESLIKNTADAVARGVFGIPTIFVNNEMFFGKERLLQVEEEILRLQS